MGDEDRAHESRLDGGNEKAKPRTAQPLEAPQLPNEPFERVDAVTPPGGILVAAALRKVAETGTQPG